MRSIVKSCIIILNNIFGVGKELANCICRAYRRYKNVFAIVLWGKCLHKIYCINIEAFTVDFMNSQDVQCVYEIFRPRI